MIGLELPSLHVVVASMTFGGAEVSVPITHLQARVSWLDGEGVAHGLPTCTSALQSLQVSVLER